MTQGQLRRALRPQHVAAVAWLLVAGSASAAPTKDECVDANTRAQSLRRENKLRDARKELLLCGTESCPAIVRDDCAQRLDELDRVMPTILFEVKDAFGRDVSDVRVTLDGAPWLQKLDGAAVPVDPGEHDFSFAMTGEEPVARRLLIREGDKSRREAISFGAKPEAPAAAVAQPATESLAPPTPAAVAKLAIIAGPEDRVTVDGTQLGVGRWEGTLPPGAHALEVTHPGKKTYQATIELQAGGVRTVEVALESTGLGIPTWVWITGGALLAGGAALGGYFLFRGEEQPGARPVGGMGSVSLSFGRLGRF